jgi:hypothetical protein
VEIARPGEPRQGDVFDEPTNSLTHADVDALRHNRSITPEGRAIYISHPDESARLRRSFFATAKPSPADRSPAQPDRN